MNLIPEGWRFYSADFSVNARSSREQKLPHEFGLVILIRDSDGYKEWSNLPDEEKDFVDLFVRGVGPNFEDALQAAAVRANEAGPVIKE